MSACSSACRCGHVTPPAPFRKFHVTILKSDRLHDVLVDVRIVTPRGHSRGWLTTTQASHVERLEMADKRPSGGASNGSMQGQDGVAAGGVGVAGTPADSGDGSLLQPVHLLTEDADSLVMTDTKTSRGK